MFAKALGNETGRPTLVLKEKISTCPTPVGSVGLTWSIFSPTCMRTMSRFFDATAAWIACTFNPFLAAAWMSAPAARYS